MLEGSTPWSDEASRRDDELKHYLQDTDSSRAEIYGFRAGHHPALAWLWFDRHPVGFTGTPFVLLQTLLALDPATERDPHLLKLAHIWRKKSNVPSEQGKKIYTLDHLGFVPHARNYANGVLKPPKQRRMRLPNGLVYSPSVQTPPVNHVDARLHFMRDGAVGHIVEELARLFHKDYDPKIAKLLVLARGAIRKQLYDDEVDYEKEHDKLQQPPKVDPVFFSCSACHQGRVIVAGEMNEQGQIVEPGRIKFLPGMPNTEIEAQYFSRLVMETGLAFIQSGFSIDSKELPQPDDIKLNRDAVLALYTRLLDRALDETTVKGIYGAEPDEIKRAKLQTYWVAKDFPTHLGNLISTAIKTQYIYYQVARQYAFNPDNPRKTSPQQKVPDVISDRIGQMDAFGIASGLVPLHTLRTDNSFMKFLYEDNPNNPLFAGIPTIQSFSASVGPAPAGKRIRDNLADWAPPVPAPIDIKSLNWTGHRVLANWDGNQGAAARTLASGTSATGDPRKVNVRIHEPLNPLINNMPPPPYPFDVDQEKARRGLAIFNGDGLTQKESCANCHRPRNGTVYPARILQVDENRARITTEVSRYGLAGTVKEACAIFMRNNPGNDWCLPKNEQGELVTNWEDINDDFFKDVPARVRNEKHGYKADMLHGIWAQAPYLHNGSVPTLMHLLCPETRPSEFKRGIIFYDRAMVGFEWQIVPQQRYAPDEPLLVKSYDTREFGHANTGHHYGSSLCPDVSGLDPINDRAEIAARISGSTAGDLLEYLKTL
ncbi:MAG: hypothetical protein L0Y43_02300 [Methylococcaceae bacterium]|nr:hypothetical protein [Methylococcaceae bacterium]